MAKKTHKPGPWWHEGALSPEESGRPIGTESRIIRRITPKEDEQAAEDGDYEDVLAEATDADYDLIAAAPELLEALRGMLESFDILDKMLVSHFRNETMQGVVRGGFLAEPSKARAAIAKATGKEVA